MRSFHRPTWAEVDLGAVRANAAFLARKAGRAGLLPVLKADAYGHGAAAVGRLLEARPPARLKGVGVSSVEEGIALRRAGLKGTVLVLGSLFPFESFAAALEHRLTPTIASLAAARALDAAARRRNGRADVHVKVDTGMGRIGMAPATALDAVPRIAALPGLRLAGVYTHLASGEDRRRVREQLAPFGTLVESLRRGGLSFMAHAANSAGLLCAPESRLDLVRPGLALYGVAPAPGIRGLAPALAWKSRIVFLKTVSKGTPVSYGGTWRAPRRARLATLPVGYADGYRRGMGGKAQVLVAGRRCPVVGRITMDQVVVDVTGLRGVDVGAEAVLLGAQGRERITAEEMAGWAGTISYEVYCGISSRVPRVYASERPGRPS